MSWPNGTPDAPRRVFALGASAGGLAAISLILAALPEGFPAPILVIQHLSPDHPSQLAEILGRRTALRVKQAEEGDRIRTRGVCRAAREASACLRRRQPFPV